VVVVGGFGAWVVVDSVVVSVVVRLEAYGSYESA
jgi:hypothetical protein